MTVSRYYGFKSIVPYRFMGPGRVFESCKDRNCGKNREVMAKSKVDSPDNKSAKENTKYLDGQDWVSEQANMRVISLLWFVFARAVLRRRCIRLRGLAFPRLRLCLLAFLSHNDY